MAEGSIVALSRDTVPTELRDKPAQAFVDVWGPQCVPCMALAPMYEELAETHGKRARFFKLEAPKNRMACVDLRVMSLPTFLVFENGVEVDRLDGDVDQARLRAWVEDKLTTTQRG